jgi:hypothetical protein
MCSSWLEVTSLIKRIIVASCKTCFIDHVVHQNTLNLRTRSLTKRIIPLSCNMFQRSSHVPKHIEFVNTQGVCFSSLWFELNRGFHLFLEPNQFSWLIAAKIRKNVSTQKYVLSIDTPFCHCRMCTLSLWNKNHLFQMFLLVDVQSSSLW